MKTPIYTGGSNDDDRVSSATVFRQQGSPLRLPSVSSIFGSKANVILHVVLDLKLVASFDDMFGFYFLSVDNWEL